jgi:YYY domain-containing protein
LLTVLVWWVWMLVFGLVAWPLAFRLFRWLPDRGYTLARPLGLLLGSYILWLGGSLGLLRNSVGGILFSLTLAAGVSAWAYRTWEREGPGLRDWLREHGRLVLAGEVLFAVALGLWAFVRALSPDLMTSGGEKFMEIMYLNAIDRSPTFPPHDAWLSGYAISYYYFGYVMIATLTRLSGFPPHLTFNVGLALIFALTCVGAFGLVYNLVAGRDRQRALGFGFLGALLVGVMGNLEGFLEVLYSARALPMAFWRWLDILDINQPFPAEGAASLMPSRFIWWWRASRVIHDLDPRGASMGVQPIDEFPGFSFLLGDMHPHVLALPFVLLALALTLNLLKREPASVPRSRTGHLPSTTGEPGETTNQDDFKPHDETTSPSRFVVWLRLGLWALCLGGLGFLNTWDFPIYLLIFVLAYGLTLYRELGTLTGRLLADAGWMAVRLGGLGVLLYLPFYVGLQSQAGGILPTLYVSTRFRQYFVMFGPFLVAVAGLLVALVARLRAHVPARRIRQAWAGWLAAFVLAPWLLMLLVVALLWVVPSGRAFLESVRANPAVQEVVGDTAWLPLLGQFLWIKLRAPWVIFLVGAALALIVVLLTTRPASEMHPASASLVSPEVQFALLCAFAGLGLTLAVEFIYLRDNFGVRANTIFKFYFQAWILMALTSAYGLYYVGTYVRRPLARRAYLGAVAVLIAMGMVYPVLANITKAGDFGSQLTLDGMVYLEDTRPDDYAAIQWLRKNVEGRPVILETPGDQYKSYVYEGRVSALTGLPTLLGWAGHESQWRGSYVVQAAREADIETLYSSFDAGATLTLLDKYDITYVYVGPLERERYPAAALDKFSQLMDVAYERGDVSIYKRR